MIFQTASKESVRKAFRVVERFRVESTNRDLQANRICGIQKSTIAGKMYPGEFRVKVSNFKADKLDRVRLVRISDGLVREVSLADGARVEAGEVVFPVPGDLAAGDYQLLVRSDGYWQRLGGKKWTVMSDESVCQSLAQVKTAEIATQLNDDDFYYGTWSGYVDGHQEMTLHGDGFSHYGEVKAVALVQGTTRMWASSLKLASNQKLEVSFDGLDKVIKDGEGVNIELYPETKDNALLLGVPPLGKLNWRKARSGLPGSMPTLTITNPGSGLIPGQRLKIECGGCAFSAKFTKLEVKSPTGKVRMLDLHVDEIEWSREKQTNTKAVLYADVPADLLTWGSGTSLMAEGSAKRANLKAKIGGEEAATAGAGDWFLRLLGAKPTTEAPVHTSYSVSVPVKSSSSPGVPGDPDKLHKWLVSYETIWKSDLESSDYDPYDINSNQTKAMLVIASPLNVKQEIIDSMWQIYAWYLGTATYPGNKIAFFDNRYIDDGKVEVFVSQIFDLGETDLVNLSGIEFLALNEYQIPQLYSLYLVNVKTWFGTIAYVGNFFAANAEALGWKAYRNFRVWNDLHKHGMDITITSIMEGQPAKNAVFKGAAGRCLDHLTGAACVLWRTE